MEEVWLQTRKKSEREEKWLEQIQKIQADVWQALKIAELLTAWCKALGIPLTASVSAVGRELLERAGREDVLVVSPVLAEPAAAEIRERMRTQLREEIEAHLRAEPHGLPAARAEENKSLLAALPTQQITRATPSSS